MSSFYYFGKIEEEEGNASCQRLNIQQSGQSFARLEKEPSQDIVQRWRTKVHQSEVHEEMHMEMAERKKRHIEIK